MLITSELAREQGLTQDEAFGQLLTLSPYDIKMRLRSVLAGAFSGLNQTIFQRESLHVKPHATINWQVIPEEIEPAMVEDRAMAQDWWHKRVIDGEIIRLTEVFYTQVWTVLQHCKGIVIGNKFDRKEPPRQPTHSVGNDPRRAKSFERRITHLLSKIHAPEYRHVNIEALRELGEIFKVNPDLYFEDYISLDVLIWPCGAPGLARSAARASESLRR